MNTLKQRLLAIAGIALALTTSVHAEELTAADVAALPQDRVRKIIKECHMPDNLIVQDICETMQLQALKRIVDRGTYQSGGSNDDGEPPRSGSGDGYSKPARDQLKKLIEKPVSTWKGALLAAVRRCFNFPYNGEDADKFEADIDIQMRPDGTVASEPVVVAVRGPSRSIGMAMAESAKRAIMQCQSYAFLPKQQYDAWKYIPMTFSLKDMQ
jgi:hypothetical protein